VTDLLLSEEQRQIIALARDFARTHIEPKAAAWDRDQQFPRDVLAELGRLGFLGMLTPDTHDGMGLDTVTYALALEEIAAADAGIALSLAIHNAVPTSMLARHGTPSQRERWLRPMSRGDLLAGVARAELEAGSDSAAIKTQALRRDNGWLLRGEKAWVTNGATADLVLVFALADEGVSAFVVPTDTPGYRPGAPIDKMGLRSSSTVPVTLDDLRLDGEHLVGAPGKGYAQAVAGQAVARIAVAALAVGIARRALEHAAAYCAERKQFGKALREFEAVQFRLADMTTRTAAARALVRGAAEARDAGADEQDLIRSASMAKLLASETAMWVTTQAVQLFGGYGYMRDFPVEKLFRDAKVTEILEGTSEMQRLTIAREPVATR